MKEVGGGGYRGTAGLLQVLASSNKLRCSTNPFPPHTLAPRVVHV